MKITKIRFNGVKPTIVQLNALKTALEGRIQKAGFITEVSIHGVAIRLGLHMKSFVLNTAKHSRNLQYNPHMKPKLTNLPTWDQRVEYNNIVNKVLTTLKVSANVKSGPYTIRQGELECCEGDWDMQKPTWVRNNEYNGHTIGECDEKEFLEERREMRLAKARAKRLEAINAKLQAEALEMLKGA